MLKNYYYINFRTREMHDQRVENQKARKRSKFVWLAGRPSLPHTTDELPAMS